MSDKLWEITDYNKYGHKVTSCIYAETVEEAKQIFRNEIWMSEQYVEADYEKSEMYDWLMEREVCDNSLMHHINKKKQERRNIYLVVFLFILLTVIVPTLANL